MMRRSCFVIVILLFTSLFLFSCIEKNNTNIIEDGHIAIIKNIHAEAALGNIEIFDKYLADNYIRHCQAMPPELQELGDKEVFKAFVKEFIDGTTDFNETFDVIVADSDKVAYVTTMTGVQSGQWGEMPPTNKPFKVVNIIVQRFEDNKIAETWVTWDNLAMMTQLGMFPPPEGEKP